MLYAFNNKNAKNRKKRQYFEMFGNRAIWVGRLEGRHISMPIGCHGSERGTAL